MDYTDRIVIFRGDDSNFVSDDTISLQICTEIDLTNCKAHFEFLGYTMDWDTIPSDNILYLKFSKDVSKEFPICSAFGCLWVENADGLKRTLNNRILIIISNRVYETYESSVIVKDTSATVLTQDGIFYLPVYIEDDVQYYRQFKQYEDDETHEVTTQLSEDLYIRVNREFVKYEGE